MRIPKVSELNKQDLEKFFLYCFAITSMISVAGATISIWILTVLVILDPKRWEDFYKKPLFILFVISFIYLSGSVIYGILQIPGSTKLQIGEAKSWVRLWLFLSVGFVIYKDEKLALRILELAFISLLLSIVIYLVQHPYILHKLPRTGFKHKIISMALYLATGILGMISFMPRMCTDQNGKISIGKLIVWYVIFFFLVEAFFITRTKGAWLAIGVVGPIIIIIRYKKEFRKIGWLLFLIVLSIFILTIANSNLIKQRAKGVVSTIKAILTQKEDRLSNKSISDRYFLFKFGLKKIKERPIIGWGAGSTIPLIKMSKDPKLARHHPTGKLEWYDHLHNLYLEIGVRFGIIGFLLIGLTMFILLHRLKTTYNYGLISKDMYLFLTGTIALFAICALSNFRILHPDHRFFWAIIGGTIYGLGMPAKSSPLKGEKHGTFKQD